MFLIEGLLLKLLVLSRWTLDLFTVPRETEPIKAELKLVHLKYFQPYSESVILEFMLIYYNLIKCKEIFGKRKLISA